MRLHIPEQPLPGGHGIHDRLPPLERTPASVRGAPEALAPVVSRDRAAAPERSPAEPTPAPGANVEVRYGLDTVANVWVAQFFDSESGAFVKSVPATRVSHQLAALRVQRDALDAEA